jgi:hypothetical protein
MAVVHGKIVPRAVRTLSGSPVPKLGVPEKATRTFKKGAIAFMSAGFLDECGANPALILGIATQDGQNGATDGLYQNIVELAHPDTLFRMYVDNNDSGTAATGAATDLLKGYGIMRGATSPNQWFVDLNRTGANVRVVIWEFWNEVSYVYVGDTLPQVIVGFVYLFFQGNIGT